MHATTDVIEVFAQLLFVLQAIDFSLFERLSIIRCVLERREQFSQGHRSAFVPTDAFIKQRRQNIICFTIQNGLGEKEGFVIVIALPSKGPVIFPDLLFNRLDFVKKDSRLVVKNFPRKTNQSAAGRQIEVFTFFHSLCEHVQKRREVNIPRVEFLLSDQGQNQRH